MLGPKMPLPSKNIPRISMKAELMIRSALAAAAFWTRYWCIGFVSRCRPSPIFPSGKARWPMSDCVQNQAANPSTTNPKRAAQGGAGLPEARSDFDDVALIRLCHSDRVAGFAEADCWLLRPLAALSLGGPTGPALFQAARVISASMDRSQP